MNTKQILYNALNAQLSIKKTEADKYTNDTYNPAVDSLKNRVLEYFTNKIGGFHSFDFTGANIRLEMGSSWYDRVDILIPNTWRNEHKDVQIDWNSGNYSTSNRDKKGYLELLNKVYSNFDEISNKFLNEWYPKHLDIENKHDDAWKEYKELKTALDNLQNEIKQDTVLTMKQIGFEIKSFKPKYVLDWEYVDSERKYNIKKHEQKLQLQYGRSQYDTTYVNGFKVMGKKGNKYKVEVYRDNQPVRTFDVLEKKFESFIEDVNEWENKKADDEKIRVEERYINYTK